MKTYNKNSIRYNYVMNLILTVSNVLFPLLTFPYFSRILLPVGIGKVAFAQSFIAYFIMIAQLGMPIYGIRKCAQVRDDKIKLSKTVHELLMISILMVIISYLILFVIIATVDKIHDNKDLILIMSTQILLNSIGMNWLYSSLEQYSYITIRSIIFKLISLIIMFILVRGSDDYLYYAIGMVIAVSGSSLLNIINAKKYIYLKPLSNYNLKQHLRPVFILFATNIAISIYVNLDVIMLGFMVGDSEVGLYNAALKVNRVLLQVVSSIGVVLLPRLSYLISNNLVDEFVVAVKKAIYFVVLISVPLVLYFIIFAKDVIQVIAGDNFLGSTKVLQILMPIVLIAGISNITGLQMLVPIGAEKKLMFSVVCGAFVDVILNIILIPKYGASGAAFSTVLAESIVLIVQIIFVKEYLANFITRIELKKILLIITWLLLVLVFINTLNFQFVYIKLVITFTFYIGMYVLSLFITKEKMTLEFIKLLRTKIQRLKEEEN